MVLTGDGEFGFDSGEGAWDMTTISKDGNMRVIYPFLIRGGSDKTY